MLVVYIKCYPVYRMPSDGSGMGYYGPQIPQSGVFQFHDIGTGFVS